MMILVLRGGEEREPPGTSEPRSQQKVQGILSVPALATCNESEEVIRGG